MTFKVTSSDFQFPNVLQKFKDDLTAMRKQFDTDINALKTIKATMLDEEIKDMRTSDTGTGEPRYIKKDPLEPIDVRSLPEGKGIKYRPEPNGAFIINNSAVCYMFDEYQIAGRNSVTAAVSTAGLGSDTANAVGATELPYVPPTPKWEIPAAQIEAAKVDHDVRLVRDVFDQPFPLPPLMSTVPVEVPYPVVTTDALPLPMLAFIDKSYPDTDPLYHRVLKAFPPLSGWQAAQPGLVALQPGDTIQLGIPSPPDLPVPLPNLSFKGVIQSIDSSTQITLTSPFPFVPSDLIPPTQLPWPAPQLPGIPAPPLPMAKIVVEYLPKPFPLSATVKALQQTVQGFTQTLQQIEPVVTPLTPVFNFSDKTENSYDANILGLPPLPILPTEALQSPFGIGKGRRFVPGSLGGVVQVEALVEGPPTKTLFRQGPGPNMSLSAVIRPDQALPGRGWTIASNSSPIPAIPFATTNYSLQLVEANGYLFPRLAWQYYDIGVLISGTAYSDHAMYASTYGALAAIADPAGAAAQALLPPEAMARRTCYAQSFVPLPLPKNDAYGYKASTPPTRVAGVPVPGAPLSSRFFVGVTRYKKELSLQTTPLMPFPLVAPYVGLMPNFDGILKDPALALEPVRLGDYVTFGNDSPSYFTNSYELWKPYGGATAPTGEILGGLVLTWPPMYMGNPPVVFPFPKGKKLYSVGVTFYIGDLETGNYFIDDFPLYGTDEFGIGHGSLFIPGHNNNLPFPINSELSDFYIGADLQTPFYGPSFNLNGGVEAAGLATGLGLDVYDIITAGHVGALIPSPSPQPDPVYSGDMYMVNIPSSKGDTKQARDQVMMDQFNACFPDYTRNGKELKRSPRSQIPNGDSVYVTYGTDLDLPESQNDSEEIKATIDALLNASSNPDTANTDAVAAAVGVPIPNQDPITGPDATELSLEPDLHMVNGRPYLPGDTPVGCFKTLVNLVGYDVAVSICTDKPNSPVLVISIQDRSESPATDSCGNSFTRVTITERILGIDISTQEALRLAGVDDYGLLILRLFWIGGLQLPTYNIQNKMNRFQLESSEKVAALTGVSNGMIEVCEIPDAAVFSRLAGSPDDIRKLFTERNPTGLNLSPTPEEMRTALTAVMTSPANVTSDGSPGVVPPFMALFRTLDLTKAFGLTQSDLDAVEAEFAQDTLVSDLCKVLFQGVSSCIRNTDLCMSSYSSALAPALQLLNFNVGMAKANAEKYILCLGNFTPSMAAAIAPGISGVMRNNPFDLPNPLTMIDPLRATTIKMATMVDNALATDGVIKTMVNQLPAIGGAISSVSSQANNILCVPRSMVEALEGGVCGIAIPPAVVSACVTGNARFQEVIQRVKEYTMSAASMVNQAKQSYLGLGDTMESTNDACKQINSDINGCLNQISGFVNGISKANDYNVANNLSLIAY